MLGVRAGNLLSRAGVQPAMRTPLIGFLLLAIACSAGATDRIPLDGASHGCGDAALFRVSADNGTVLSLYWPGAATGTWEANDTTKTITGEIGTQGIEVQLEVGRYLGQMVCNDAVEQEPVVERVYTGISGSVEMTLTAAGGQDFPTAEGRITDLVLRSQDGTVINASEVTFAPATVGWFAG